MHRFKWFKAVFLATLMVLGAFTVFAPESGAEGWISNDLGKPYQRQASYGLWGVSVGDGDNDGKMEVYVASMDNGHIYEYRWDDGKWSNKDIGNIGQGQYTYATTVLVGDGDDNGKNEVYLVGYRYSQLQQPPWWEYNYSLYQLVKTDTGWVNNWVCAMTTWGYGIAIGDGNMDSRKEIYIAGQDGHIYMTYKSNSWKQLEDIGSMPASGTYYDYMYGVDVGDGDNDGNLEVYGASSDNHIYKFSYSGSAWSRSDVGQGDSTGNYWNDGMSGVVVGDADNDGKKELYSSGYANASLYRFKWNTGTSAWDRTLLSQLGTNVQAYSLCIGDGNSDGGKELYAGTSNNQVYQVIYNNATSSWEKSTAGSGGGGIRKVDIGSGTNDSYQKEIYAASEDGHLYQFYTDRTPPANPALWSDTHPKTDAWYKDPKVHMLWKDGPFDFSGIDGYSVQWDEKALTVPDEVKDHEESIHDNWTVLSDGASWYFHIRARDNSLNWNKSANHYGPVKIDSRAPTSMSLKINDGADYTNNKLVTLSIDAVDPSPGSGVAYMAFSNDDNSWSEWEAFSQKRGNWDLTEPKYGGKDYDGGHVVYAKVMDLVGNEIDIANRTKDSIFLDRVAPTELGIVINGGATYTTMSNVSLNLTARDPEPASGLSKISFSNDGITWSDPADWSQTTYWSLTTGAGGSDSDGNKTVFFRVLDNAGNYGGPVKASIFLDRKAPDGLSITINDGAEYTNDPSVFLKISATDPDPGSQLDQMSIANDANQLGTWEAYFYAKRGWSLISGTGGVDKDGDKPVYLQVSDKAGNIGGPVKDTIFLDRVKPSPLVIIINDDATYTTSVNVKLMMKAMDPDPASGVYAMQFSDDGQKWSDWEPYQPSKAYTLPAGDGTKTVYFRVNDKAGNIADMASDSIILDTAGPVITNVRVVGITDISATITWTTNEESDSGMDFGLTSAYGTSTSDSIFVTSHSLTLKGLTASTTYHFRCYSRDRAGNPPTYTGDYVFITSATPDTTPPMISNVLVSGITDKLAVISWTTNEPADSLVEFGKDTLYGMKAFDANYVLKHSVTVTGLGPMMLYHLRVGSRDPSGNGPTWSADTTFTTLQTPDTTPPKISNIRVSGITDRLAVVSWETDEPADGVAEYGNSTAYGATVQDTRLLVMHEATLTSLKAYTLYHFRVRSKDATGNGPSASEDQTFMTSAIPDTLAPIIFNVRVDAITENSASVLWDTDEVSDGVVEYGYTTAYNLSSADSTYLLTHSMLLQALAPGTTYHFRVRSVDPSGNAGMSGDYIFKTKKSGGTTPDVTPPVISGVIIEGISNTRAVVIWQTDELANSEVEYGNTTLYGLRSSDATYTVLHSVLLEGLKPSTEYNFRVKSTDVFGNGPSVSLNLRFVTAMNPDIIPPTISNIRVTNITNTSATISWLTNEPAQGVVEYGIDALYGRNVTTRMYLLNHSITLTGLAPGITYHYRINLSMDSSGNIAPSSADQTFTTLKVYVPPTPTPVKPTTKISFQWWWAVLALVIAAGVIGGVWGYKRYTSSKYGAEVLDMEMEPEELHDDSDLDDSAAGDSEADGDLEGDVETVDMGDAGDVETVSMEDTSNPEFGRDSGQVETLPMDEGAETVKMEGSAAAGGAAAVLAARTASRAAPGPEPVKHIKCPACKTRIPLYNDEAQEVQCPSCGKKGPYRPKAAPAAAPPLTALAKATGKTPVKTIKCTGCGSSVPIYTTNYPVRIQCPGCGKSGMYKGPKQ